MEDFELYEIKSDNRGEIAKGNAEVRLYEFAARRHCDKRWHAGRSYPREPRQIFASENAVLFAARGFPGLIIYKWVPKKKKPKLEQKAAAAVAAKPQIPDLHKALKPWEAILRSEVKQLFPGAQPGDEVLVVTSPEIVLQYLNLAAAEADKALFRVPVNPRHMVERGAYQAVLFITAVGLTLAISFATLAPAAAAAPAVAPAAAAGAAAAPAAGAKILLFSKAAVKAPELRAAAGFVATFLLTRSAEAARLTRSAEAAQSPRDIGKLEVLKLNKVMAASIPEGSKRVGSSVIVDGQEKTIVGLGVFR